MGKENAIRLLEKEIDILIDELNDESFYAKQSNTNVSEDFWDRCDWLEALRIAKRALEREIG